MQRGFTLPELLVVVAIVGVFTIGASVLIHPLQVDAARRDAERWTGAAQLAQVLGQYVRDQGGLPPALNSGDIELIGTDKDMIDLCAALTPTYVDKLPIDPGVTAKANSDCEKGGVMITGYAVQKISDTAFEVSAPLAEADDVLVKRQF